MVNLSQRYPLAKTLTLGNKFFSSNNVADLLTTHSVNLQKLVTYGAALEDLIVLTEKLNGIHHYEFRNNKFANETSLQFKKLFENIFKNKPRTIVIENLPVDDVVVVTEFCDYVAECNTLLRLEVRKISESDSKFFMKIFMDLMSENTKIEHLSIPNFYNKYIDNMIEQNVTLKILHLNCEPNISLLNYKCEYKPENFIYQTTRSEEIGTLLENVVKGRMDNSDLGRKIKNIMKQQKEQIVRDLEIKLGQCAMKCVESNLEVVVGQNVKTTLARTKHAGEICVEVNRFERHSLNKEHPYTQIYQARLGNCTLL